MGVNQGREKAKCGMFYYVPLPIKDLGEEGKDREEKGKDRVGIKLHLCRNGRIQGLSPSQKAMWFCLMGVWEVEQPFSGRPSASREEVGAASS